MIFRTFQTLRFEINDQEIIYSNFSAIQSNKLNSYENQRRIHGS